MGYDMKKSYLEGGIGLWWGEIKIWRRKSTGEIFLGLGVSKYLAGRRGTPPTPTSRENPANMCEV